MVAASSPSGVELQTYSAKGGQGQLIQSSTTTPPEPAEQALIIEETLKSSEPKIGDLWYVVPLSWWEKWVNLTDFKHWTSAPPMSSSMNGSLSPSRKFVPSSSSQLGSIPTTAITESQSSTDEFEKIIKALTKQPHYVPVPRAVWDILTQWYGLNGPEIKRPIVDIQPSDPIPKVKIDPYANDVNVILQSEPNVKKRVIVSKTATVGMLKQQAVELFNIDMDKCKMFDYYNGTLFSELEDKLDKTIEEVNIMDQQDIILDDTGKVAMASPQVNTHTESTSITPFTYSSYNYTPSYRYTNNYSTLAVEDHVNSLTGAKKGQAGLTNLGNTCFMNSSLQCLAHTVSLMSFFLSGKYQEDINVDNPIGMKGELAKAFGALMRKLWQGNVRSVSPKFFKQQLAKFAPQFSGYLQHDSQELLGFLLDGLHEDLNRVKQKPYIEAEETDGKSDEVLAQEAWDRYKARNDSVIVDHFQYLIKSTLDCPQCGKESVKFDPYMYLQLPMPGDNLRFHEVIVVKMDGSGFPLKYVVELQANATVRDMYMKLGKLCQLKNMSLEYLQARLVVALYVHSFTASNSPSNLKPLDDIRGSVPDLSYQDRFIAYFYPEGCEYGPASGGTEAVFMSKRSSYPVYIAGMFPVLMYVKQELASSDNFHVYTRMGYQKKMEVRCESGLVDLVDNVFRPMKRLKHNDNFTSQSGNKDEGESQFMANGNSVKKENLAISSIEEEVDTKNEEQMDYTCVPSKEDTSKYPFATSADQISSILDQDEAIQDMEEDNCSNSPDVGDNDQDMTGLDDNTDVLDTSNNNEDSNQSSGDAYHAPISRVSSGPPPPPPLPQLNHSQDTNSKDNEKSSASQNQRPQHPFTIKKIDSSGSEFLGVSQSSFSLSKNTNNNQLYFMIEWDKNLSLGITYDCDTFFDKPADHSSVEDAQRKKAQAKQPVDLQQCIQAFLEPERLSENDLWYCPKCKTHVRALKKLDIWSLPEVLVIHLKRFRYSRYTRNKIDNLIRFPINDLDLVPYVTQHEQSIPPHYDLFAVSNHYGSLSGGHYTAYCKMPDDGKWYSFDDSLVTPVTDVEKDVVSEAAYVLFYRRQSEGASDQQQVVRLLNGEDDMIIEENQNDVSAGAAQSDTDEVGTWNSKSTRSPQENGWLSQSSHGQTNSPINGVPSSSVINNINTSQFQDGYSADSDDRNKLD